MKGERRNAFQNALIYFVPEKKICVPTLPKIFRPVTRNTFSIWPYGKWQLTSSGVAVIDGYLVFSLVTPSPTVLSILIAVILNKTKSP